MVRVLELPEALQGVRARWKDLDLTSEPTTFLGLLCLSGWVCERADPGALTLGQYSIEGKKVSDSI